MHLTLGIEVEGKGEGLGVLFVGDDTVQTWMLDKLIGLEGREINLAHKGEKGSPTLGSEDEGCII